MVRDLRAFVPAPTLANGRSVAKCAPLQRTEGSAALPPAARQPCCLHVPPSMPALRLDPPPTLAACQRVKNSDQRAPCAGAHAGKCAGGICELVVRPQIAVDVNVGANGHCHRRSGASTGSAYAGCAAIHRGHTIMRAAARARCSRSLKTCTALGSPSSAGETSILVPVGIVVGEGGQVDNASTEVTHLRTPSTSCLYPQSTACNRHHRSSPQLPQA